MEEEDKDARIRALEAELEQLLRRLGHDLKTPIRQMRGFSDVLLADWADKLDPRGREFLGYIRDGALRVDAMISGLIDLSRALQRPITLGPIPLARAVEKASERAARAEAHAFEAVPPMPVVLGDEHAVVESLAELIANGAKFSRREGGEHPKIKVWTEDRGERVRVVVQDGGDGIPRNLQKNLFQPFERLDARAEIPGLGLGLVRVRRAMARLRGDAGVDSEPGLGTRFWLELPKV